MIRFEVILDLGSRDAVLDCFNDVVVSPGELCEFGLGRAQRSVLLATQPVHVARVFLVEFFQQRGFHQARLQRRDHHAFQFVLPDGQAVISLAKKPWEPTVTEDRLPTILELAGDCGMIDRSDGGFHLTIRP